MRDEQRPSAAETYDLEALAAEAATDAACSIARQAHLDQAAIDRLLRQRPREPRR